MVCNKIGRGDLLLLSEWFSKCSQYIEENYLEGLELEFQLSTEEIEDMQDLLIGLRDMSNRWIMHLDGCIKTKREKDNGCDKTIDVRGDGKRG